MLRTTLQVNNAKNYIDLMGFGYVAENGDPVVTDSLLQGGIVSPIATPVSLAEALRKATTSLALPH
jgi:hypothetical protein